MGAVQILSLALGERLGAFDAVTEASRNSLNLST